MLGGEPLPLSEATELALRDEEDLRRWRRERSDEINWQPPQARPKHSAYGRLRRAIRNDRKCMAELRAANQRGNLAVADIMRITDAVDAAVSELCAAKDAYRRSKCNGN